MNVILLENMRRGRFGEVISVAKGYARNYLIPYGKAVQATRENLAMFEARRAELEAQAKARLEQAQARAQAMAAITLQLSARASDEGRLFGSIGIHELMHALQEAGHAVERKEVILSHGAFREIGEKSFELQLHPEVSVTVGVHIHPAK